MALSGKAQPDAIAGAIPNDVALARLVKGRGYHIAIADGQEWVQVRMYRSLGKIWRGFSKNVFSGMNRSVATLLALVILLLELAVAPLVLAGLSLTWLAAGDRTLWNWLLLAVSGMASLQMFYLGGMIARGSHVPARYGLFFPFEAMVVIGIMVNSALQVTFERGVTWKGRRYPG